jgi:hypothetical protein
MAHLLERLRPSCLVLGGLGFTLFWAFGVRFGCALSGRPCSARLHHRLPDSWRYRAAKGDAHICQPVAGLNRFGPRHCGPDHCAGAIHAWCCVVRVGYVPRASEAARTGVDSRVGSCSVSRNHSLQRPAVRLHRCKTTARGLGRRDRRRLPRSAAAGCSWPCNPGQIKAQQRTRRILNRVIGFVDGSLELGAGR